MTSWCDKDGLQKWSSQVYQALMMKEGDAQKLKPVANISALGNIEGLRLKFAERGGNEKERLGDLVDVQCIWWNISINFTWICKPKSAIWWIHRREITVLIAFEVPSDWYPYETTPHVSFNFHVVVLILFMFAPTCRNCFFFFGKGFAVLCKYLFPHRITESIQRGGCPHVPMCRNC